MKGMETRREERQYPRHPRLLPECPRLRHAEACPDTGLPTSDDVGLSPPVWTARRVEHPRSDAFKPPSNQATHAGAGGTGEPLLIWQFLLAIESSRQFGAGSAGPGLPAAYEQL